MRAVRHFGRNMETIRHPLSMGILAMGLVGLWRPLPQALGQGQTSTDDKAVIGAISQALRSRDFVRAEELSKAAVVAHPNDCRFWTLRGMSEDGLGNRRMALSHYQHALKLVPNYLPALEGAAQTAFQLGDASAGPALEKILAQRPDEPTSHAMLGV